jgi:predicted SAM-dependent methyltransferase
VWRAGCFKIERTSAVSPMSQLNPSLSSLSIKRIVAPAFAQPKGYNAVVTIVRNLKNLLRSLIGKKTYDSLGRILPRRSETGRHRALLEKFCVGCGIDIGFGGDPITPGAIRMDLPSPYTSVGRSPVQLGGDCRNLHWLRDGVLDYVYSSHVLEDFPESETLPVLQEWTRVLRPDGRMILLLPDQQRYLAYCRRTGQISADGVLGNPHHSIATFSMQYVDLTVARLRALEKIASFEALGPYSFAVVYEKKKS